MEPCKTTEGELSFSLSVTPLKQMDDLEAVDISQQGAAVRLQVTTWKYKDQEIMSCNIRLKLSPQRP